MLKTIAALIAAITTGALIFVGAGIVAATPAQPALAGSMVKLALPQGHCSGVHISGDLLLTAGHCADPKAKAITDDGVTWTTPTDLLWASDDYDVALFSVQGISSGARSAPVACRATRVGEEVHAAGNPGGLEFMHVWGRVAKGEHELKQGRDERGRPLPSWRSVVSLDITGMGGMSGGPVYDRYGSVVGVIVAGYGVPFPLRSFMEMVPSTTICKLMGRV